MEAAQGGWRSECACVVLGPGGGGGGGRMCLGGGRTYEDEDALDGPAGDLLCRGGHGDRRCDGLRSGALSGRQTDN